LKRERERDKEREREREDCCAWVIFRDIDREREQIIGKRERARAARAELRRCRSAG